VSLTTLSLPLYYGPRDCPSYARHYEVEAEAVGPFYIFRTYECNEYWTLLHANTKRAIRKFLKSRASARRLARALRGFDWDYTLTSKAHLKTGWRYIPLRVRADMRKAAKIAKDWERE
jgi:hypothetical protein